MNAGSVVLRPTSRVVRGRRHSVVVDRRAGVVVGLLALTGLALAGATLVLGVVPLPVGDVLRALLGERHGLASTIVVDWRLPRVTACAVFGLALGMSGAVFQSLSRNPLGSPDVIGFDTGAATGALLVILVLRGDQAELAGGAIAGGALTALAVYVLAYRRGVQGFRLILVGIAVSAMLEAVNVYLILRADELERLRVSYWTAGSLNGIGWSQVAPSGLLMAVLIPATLSLSRALRWSELGDDTAVALGVPVQRTRLAAVVLAVALTATVTAAAGPISFIALAAPQLAVRLTRSPGLALLPAGVMGAVLLIASDLAAQRLLAPAEVPVGAVTISVGGVYFVWLLARERRR